MQPSSELGKVKPLASVEEADETPISLKFRTTKKGLKIEWDENDRQGVLGWYLYVGTMAENGGYKWVLYKGNKGLDRYETIPFDQLPKKEKIYAQVEATLSGGETILSEVESWSFTL